MDTACVLLSGGGIILIALEAHRLLDKDLSSRRGDVARRALRHVRGAVFAAEEATQEDRPALNPFLRILLPGLNKKYIDERNVVREWSVDLVKALDTEEEFPQLKLIGPLSPPWPTARNPKKLVDKVKSCTKNYIDSYQILSKPANEEEIDRKIVICAPFLVLSGVALQMAILCSKPISQ